MIYITYLQAVIAITAAWLLARTVIYMKHRHISLRREAMLLLVYISLLVVARFTFFPFEKLNGSIQPLVLDTANVFPFRINLVPFANITDYPDIRSIKLNIIGNTAMFIPIGIIWPSVFRELNTHKKAIAAGIGFSLIIELLQLPFIDRVSDIDDLLLNSVGYLVGYGIYLLCKRVKHRYHR